MKKHIIVVLVMFTITALSWWLLPGPWPIMPFLFLGTVLRLAYPKIMDEVDDEHPPVIPLPRL